MEGACFICQNPLDVEILLQKVLCGLIPTGAMKGKSQIYRDLLTSAVDAAYRTSWRSISAPMARCTAGTCQRSQVRFPACSAACISRWLIWDIHERRPSTPTRGFYDRRSAGTSLEGPEARQSLRGALSQAHLLLAEDCPESTHYCAGVLNSLWCESSWVE